MPVREESQSVLLRRNINVPASALHGKEKGEGIAGVTLQKRSSEAKQQAKVTP